MKTLLLSLAIVLSLLPTHFLNAADIHVPGDASTIQGGIDLAANGDVVRVEAGAYPENIDFLGKEITVIAVQGPDSTIIDGQLIAPAVRFGTNENSLAILQGFTITNGYSEAICGIAGCDYFGGAIDITDASPTLFDLRITGNETIGLGMAADTAKGGAILVKGGAPTIYRCLFVQNSSDFTGGAIHLEDSQAIVDRCTFYANTAMTGSAISISGGQALVENNIIWNNSGFLQLDNQSLMSTVDYNNVEGTMPTGNSINIDPQFSNPAAFNFYLMPTSPCHNAGNPNSPVDPDGTVADMGVFPFNVGTTWFKRGDCNYDDSVNLADVILLLGILFPAGTAPISNCEDACDATDDEVLNLADAIRILGALFGSPTIPLPAPYGVDGPDPTSGPFNQLGC